MGGRPNLGGDRVQSAGVEEDGGGARTGAMANPSHASIHVCSPSRPESLCHAPLASRWTVLAQTPSPCDTASTWREAGRSAIGRCPPPPRVCSHSYMPTSMPLTPCSTAGPVWSEGEEREYEEEREEERKMRMTAGPINFFHESSSHISSFAH